MFSSSWDPCDPQATTLFLWDRTEGACASTRTVGDAQTTADALPTRCGPVILKGVCLADKTKEAKNKIILFLCFMSFLFTSQKKREYYKIAQSLPDFRYVMYELGWVLSAPVPWQSERAGSASRVHCGWKTFPLHFLSLSLVFAKIM